MAVEIEVSRPPAIDFLLNVGPISTGKEDNSGPLWHREDESSSFGLIAARATFTGFGSAFWSLLPEGRSAGPSNTKFAVGAYECDMDDSL